MAEDVLERPVPAHAEGSVEPTEEDHSRGGGQEDRRGSIFADDILSDKTLRKVGDYLKENWRLLLVMTAFGLFFVVIGHTIGAAGCR